MTSAEVAGVTAGASRTAKIAGLLEVTAFVLLALCVVIGLALAVYHPGQEGNGQVFVGLMIAVGGAFQCLWLAMIAGYVKVRLKSAKPS